MISACSHQPIVQETKQVEPLVINPVVPVLDTWDGDQAIATESYLTEDAETEPGTNNDLWQRIINAYGFNQDIDNPRIQSQLNYYKRHQAYMDRIATRAERYMYFIAEQVDVRGIPVSYTHLTLPTSDLA